MDFDPSEFLAVAMSEDQDAVYTAPDLSQPDASVQFAQDTITVEGGLELEKDLHVPVPVFGMLNLQDQDVMMENEYEEGTSNENGPLHIDEPEESVQVDLSTSHPSPTERTSSPHFSKKIIPTSQPESRFRKNLFCGAYERVKLFRLHCTICDKHLGCAPFLTERQMRMHKLLSVPVCRKCFDFYGDINFPVEDGSEMYCCWCGQGGDVFCCSKCPRTVCKKCIRRNFGQDKINEISDNDNWVCFVCDSVNIWPHRAILWGLQRFGREMRQRVALLPKEEKQAKLSNDTSHCCSKSDQPFPLISLPPKGIMAKVPICLIAVLYQPAVRKQAEQESVANIKMPSLSESRMVSPAMNNINHQTKNTFYRLERPQGPVPVAGSVIASPMNQQNLPSNYLLKQHIMCKGNRPTPYPTQAHRLPPPLRPIVRQDPYPRPSTVYNGVPSQSYIPPEVIDLVDEPPARQPTHDISWLEKSVNDVTQCLMSVNLMLSQFPGVKNEFIYDFDRTRTFAERLSYNIKIAICNLAKINQDIVDNRKVAIDKQVMAVVKNIQMSGIITNAETKNQSRSQISNTVPSSNPAPVAKANSEPKSMPNSPSAPKTAQAQVVDSPRSEPTTPSTSDGDLGYLTPALLCETVLEVEGNKENDSGNKSKIISVRKNTSKRSKPFVKLNGSKSIVQSKIPQTEIHVIDLSDDDEGSKFNASYYLKKFKIKPCKVVLKRLNPKIK